MKKEKAMRNNHKLLLFLVITSFFSFSSCQNSGPESTTEAITEITDSNEKNEKKPVRSKTSAPPLPSWPEQAKQQTGKRFPFDEARQDTAFTAFRNEVYRAAWEKDREKLLRFISDDIKFSFGGEYGKQDFIKAWQLDTQARESDFWQKLIDVLKLGGGFGSWGPDQFYAPYIFVLDDIEDPYTQGVITGENVRLRSNPGSKSEILGSMSWDLVEILDQQDYVSEDIGGETHVWQKVKTQKGETGFVYDKYLRTPVDYRAGFSKQDGKWVMDLFIAGD